MQLLVPAYYSAFRCIAGACRHSCCVGWEIDIDEETLSLYRDMPGELGKKVRESLTETDGVACFRLGEGERCPHLNEQGLCEIILGAGEDYLSQICYDHPRFRNYVGNRIEMGIGLSCEAAARLILTWRPTLTYTRLESDGVCGGLTQFEETLLFMRGESISLAQDRTLPIHERLNKLVIMSRMKLPTENEWIDHLLTLERLDPLWGEILTACRNNELPKNTGTALPYTEMSVAIEQFLVYQLYRHVADAKDTETIRAYIAFAVANTRLMATLFAACGSMDAMVDFARMWSSEIEYSTENVAACIAFLSTYHIK